MVFLHSAHHINAFVPWSSLKSSTCLPFKFFPWMTSPLPCPWVTMYTPITPTHKPLQWATYHIHMNGGTFEPPTQYGPKLSLFPMCHSRNRFLFLWSLQHRVVSLCPRYNPALHSCTQSLLIPVVSSFCLSLHPSSSLIHPTLPSHPDCYCSLPVSHPSVCLILFQTAFPTGVKIIFKTNQTKTTKLAWL